MHVHVFPLTQNGKPGGDEVQRCYITHVTIIYYLLSELPENVSIHCCLVGQANE